MELRDEIARVAHDWERSPDGGSYGRLADRILSIPKIKEAYLSQEEEYTVGQLGATVKLPRGHPDKLRAMSDARLAEIERRILAIEAALATASAPTPGGGSV